MLAIGDMISTKPEPHRILYHVLTYPRGGIHQLTTLPMALMEVDRRKSGMMK
jgi:hypothetical protein